MAPLKADTGVEDAEVGVVDVRPPLGGRANDWLSDELDKSARTAIGKMKLAKEQRVWRACKKWATDAGLESGSVRY